MAQREGLDKTHPIIPSYDRESPKGQIIGYYIFVPRRGRSGASGSIDPLDRLEGPYASIETAGEARQRIFGAPP
jgi:hypothetical protein